MTDATLAEIRAFRRAARAIIRDQSLPRTKQLAALIDLGAEARASEAAPLLQAGVWAEAREFLGDPERVVPPADPAEGALRRLIAGGRPRCPGCRRRIPTAEELDLQRRRREFAIAEVALFEEAV